MAAIEKILHQRAKNAKLSIISPRTTFNNEQNSYCMANCKNEFDIKKNNIKTVQNHQYR